MSDVICHDANSKLRYVEDPLNDAHVPYNVPFQGHALGLMAAPWQRFVFFFGGVLVLVLVVFVVVVVVVVVAVVVVVVVVVAVLSSKRWNIRDVPVFFPNPS